MDQLAQHGVVPGHDGQVGRDGDAHPLRLPQPTSSGMPWYDLPLEQLRHPFSGHTVPPAHTENKIRHLRRALPATLSPG